MLSSFSGPLLCTFSFSLSTFDPSCCAGRPPSAPHSVYEVLGFDKNSQVGIGVGASRMEIPRALRSATCWRKCHIPAWVAASSAPLQEHQARRPQPHTAPSRIAQNQSLPWASCSPGISSASSFLVAFAFAYQISQLSGSAILCRAAVASSLNGSSIHGS